jgi:holdfast attachment protein HfaA
MSKAKLLMTGALVAATAAMAAGLAMAQSMSGNGANFNSGYGRVNGQENRPVDFSLRDANGNLTVVDGILQGGGSSFASNSGTASASASASFSGGVGSQASASAIGNNLTVVTNGDFNTVIVNSTQINNGNVSAGATASGGPKNAQ